MATIPTTGILTGQAIEANHVLNIIKALDGTNSNEIVIDGITTLNSNLIANGNATFNNSVRISPSLSSAGTNVLTVDGSGNVFKTGSYAPGSGIAGVSSFTNTNGVFISAGTENSSANGAVTMGTIDLSATGTKTIDTVLRGDNTFGTPTTASHALTSVTSVSASNAISSSHTITASFALEALNAPLGGYFGTQASEVNVGPFGAKLLLNPSIGILNTNKAYFYGNSGDGALNVGIGSGPLNNANNRIKMRVFSNSSEMIMRGNDAGTETAFTVTNYGSFTSLNNSGSRAMFISFEDAASQLAFGSSATGNYQIKLNSANNPNKYKPSQGTGQTYGGLYVHHVMEVNTDTAYLNGSTTWNSTSDERVKENITEANLDKCYDVIKNLKLKRYKYKDDFSEDPLKDTYRLGWIAQDVVNFLPKSVNQNETTLWTTYTGSSPIVDSNLNININPGDRVQNKLAGSKVIEDSLSLNIDQIISMMYGTIQKLQQKVEALEAQINGKM